MKRLSTSSGVGLLLGLVLESTVSVPSAFFVLFSAASSPVNMEYLFGFLDFRGTGLRFLIGCEEEWGVNEVLLGCEALCYLRIQ